MDVTDFMESEYITTEMVANVKDNTAIILERGHSEETTFGIRFTTLVAFDGKIKKYQPNKQSLQNISSAWGTISDTWLNCVIRFQIEKSSNGKEIVVAYPVKKNVNENNTQTSQPAQLV
jgi:hypothetical protein